MRLSAAADNPPVHTQYGRVSLPKESGQEEHKQTQTATRHSDSLPVQELVYLGLLTTLSATTNGNFRHNVVGSMLPVCARNGWPEHPESGPGRKHAA